jgi:succinyl-CoA synthetase beta subunit
MFIPIAKSVLGVRIFEYQAKELCRSYGIPVPASNLAANPEEARAFFSKMQSPVVLKAQVLAGGRGKAGGVVVVSNADQASSEAKRILALSIGDEKPSSILVEESFPHEVEMYLSVTLDRGERTFVVIASRAGGIEVESMSGKIVKAIPLNGIDDDFARRLALELGLAPPAATQFATILMKLEKLGREKECELAEINPLAVGHNGEFMALDAKVVLDDNALFRHPEFSKIHPEDQFEGEASRQGFAFVHLDGDIAVVGNGAGLVMSTLDLVTDSRGRPACFLDLGGGAQKERVEAALRLVNHLPRASVILFNIFGGITRTTDVAEGIKSVMASEPLKPIFARISGADEGAAKAILQGTNVQIFQSAIEAVKAAVESS